MVGFARTTLYRTMEPGGLDAEGEKAQDLAWFDYVAAGPEPRIVMVQDGDTPHAATNALFGEVMSFMHSALGCIGLITNGAVRDVAGMVEGFQALYGGLAPNRADFHRADFDCEVNVAGLYARTDTLVHADVNGAVAVPLNTCRRSWRRRPRLPRRSRRSSISAATPLSRSRASSASGARAERRCESFSCRITTTPGPDTWTSRRRGAASASRPACRT